MHGGKVQQPKPGYISVEIITDILEGGKKPSVAAIDGLALGGGLEVAMVQNGVAAMFPGVTDNQKFTDVCFHIFMIEYKVLPFTHISFSKSWIASRGDVPGNWMLFQLDCR